MVLGLRSKSKKATSISIEFVIHLQEIKPWPIATTSKSPSSVILQWERGDKHSGSSKSVAPSPGEGKDAHKLVFNEKFTLPTTLYREAESKSSKSSHSHTQGGRFEKKCVVFSLIAVKGQTLARGVLDLASYATLDSVVTATVPLAMGRKASANIAGNPHLILRIAPSNRNLTDRVEQTHEDGLGATASSRGFNPQVGKEKLSPKLDNKSRESLVAALLSDEDEIASFTDDEDSPRSSSMQLLDLPVDNSQPRTLHSPNVEPQPATSIEVSELESKYVPMLSTSNVHALPVRSAAAAAASAYASKKTEISGQDNSSRSSSVDLSSEPASPGTEEFLTPSSLGAQSPAVAAKFPTIPPLSSPLRFFPKASAIIETEATELVSGPSAKVASCKNLEVDQKDVGIDEPSSLKQEKVKVPNSWTKAAQKSVAYSIKAKSDNNAEEELWGNSPGYGRGERGNKANHDGEEGDAARAGQEKLLLKAETNLSKDDTGDSRRQCSGEVSPISGKDGQVRESKDSPYPEDHVRATKGKVKGEKELESGSLIDSSLKVSQGIEDKKPNMENGTELNIFQTARMKFAMGTQERNEKLERKAFDEAKIKLAAAEAKAAAADYKVKELETRIHNLEGELVDAAAIELSLYSVVAQHGSSPHKVHSPARRIARLYVHACKNWSRDRRSSCARSCVSGLVLVARACGNDVTRLSYWLSNVVVLREMISQAFELTPASPAFPESKPEKSVIVLSKNDANTSSVFVGRTQGLEDSQSGCSEAAESSILLGLSTDWPEPNTFVVALERVEGWIFGRIVESVWWQALTPPMQRSAEIRIGSSSAEDALDETKPSEIQKAVQGCFGQELEENHQGNLCVELWKSAFLDVVQRICPVRAGGHECGCLRCLIKLILEQCIARLDVAMFNAILRDPDEWAPMDPIADPIVDPSVLPISAGNLSFGGGAQLKNAIRTWSTWLAAFTVGQKNSDDDNTTAHSESIEVSPSEIEKVPTLFTLLRAMADLLMLPKDMLMDKSVRKEVCPDLSLPLIKRILANFVPDEFSPDPVTPSLLAAITAEIALEKQMHGEVDASSGSPAIVAAPHVQYLPPLSSCVQELIGDATSRPRLGRNSSSLLRKAHTSDDELEELELPLSFMKDSAPPIHGCGIVMNGSCDDIKESKMESGFVKRFQLLKKVWYST